jgi:hypothetical protein
VLLDRHQKTWTLAALVGFVVALAVYIPYARAALRGPRGGSPIGLAFGIAGSALMVFAGLLAARKKVPVWRLGSAQTWMKGHLWLGLLSFPLILFHSGFRFGGPLTTALMWLFIIVIVSGIVGALLQNYLPRIMMSELPLETVYEEIPHVRAQLLAEANQLLASALGSPSVEPNFAAVPLRLGAAATAAAPVEVEKEAAERLAQFFRGEVRPFLENPKSAGHPLADSHRAESIFRDARIVLPPPLATALDELEDICEEERQLTKQDRLHRILHGWLLVHVPLSFALLLLAAVHAVMALYY